MSFSEFPSYVYFVDTAVFHCCFGGLTPSAEPEVMQPLRHLCPKFSVHKTEFIQVIAGVQKRTAKI
ncbi:hypothetical protein FVB43_15930 [Erwinia rhapontici]|nr:hypothetical protein [Erwinia rhapontici]